MRKLKVFSAMFLASLMTMSVATSVSALSWKDGALSKYYFTYTGGDEGVASVTASDTNNTYAGEVKEGQTIVTKTGTIVWRDSYTNVTTFNVDLKPGYVLDSLNGNVGDGVFEENTATPDINDYTFKFTDKGAEAWCYGDDVDFSISTKKVEYTLVDLETGGAITTARVGEPLELSWNIPSKPGHVFAGWTFDGEAITDTVLTEAMVNSANGNNEIGIKSTWNVAEYPLTINYYVNNDNGLDGGYFEGSKEVKVKYGTVLTNENIHLILQVPEEYVIPGDKEIVIGEENNTINLVKADKSHSQVGGTRYTFTYTSKTDGIEGVTYTVNDGQSTEIELNETIQESTGSAFDYDTIVFTVKVADGKKLVLDCDGTDNAVTDNGDGTYSFQITVNGYNHASQAHFDFNLSAVDK